MLTVDYVGAIFRNWMGEVRPNSYFTLNNSTFYMVEGDYQNKCLTLMKNIGSMKYNSDFLKEDGSLDYSIYAEFFADNIQRVEVIDNLKIAEGLSYDEFLEDWNKDINNNVEIINRFLGLSETHEETKMRVKMLTQYKQVLSGYGIDIDYSNLFFLCLFIREIVTNGYVALLKPSAKDMLSMIGDIGKICIMPFPKLT